MESDVFSLLLSAIVFFIYSSICIISLIFTFSLDMYYKIDERLRLEIFSSRILSPLVLERDIDWLNVWLTNHNKIAGPFLTLLSLTDLTLLFNIINTS